MLDNYRPISILQDCVVDYPNEWYVNVDHDLAMVVLLYLKKTFNTVNHEIL